MALTDAQRSGTNSTVAKLNEALAAAQLEFLPIEKHRSAKVKGVAKGSGNAYEYTYKYADLADCVRATLQALNRHGLTIRQPIRNTGVAGQMLLVTEIHHTSGEYSRDDGIPIRKLDSMSFQDFAAEVSFARRIGYCSMLAIAPDQNEDEQIDKSRQRQEKDLAGAKQRTPQAMQNPAVTGPFLGESELEYLKGELKNAKKTASEMYLFLDQRMGSSIPEARYAEITRWIRAPKPPEKVAQAFGIAGFTPHEAFIFSEKREFDWEAVASAINGMIDAEPNVPPTGQDLFTKKGR